MNQKTKTSLLLALGALLLALGPTGCSKESKTQGHLNRAEAHFKAGKFDSARIEYLSALRLQPTNTIAIVRLGKILFDQGDLQNAAPYIARATQLQPDNLEAHYQLGFLYLAARQLDKAKAEADFILSKDPGYADAILLLVDTATKPEDIEPMRATLTALRAKAGDKAAFHIALASLALRKRDPATAEKELRQAITLDPKSVGAHLTLAELYWSQSRTNEAGALLKTAADLPPPKSRAKLRYAQYQLQTGKVEEAKKGLEQATDAAADFVPAWILRAEIALAERKLDESAGFIEKALARAPNSIEAHTVKAQLLLAQNKPADAVKELEALKRLYPRNPQLLYRLALAQLINQDTTAATVNLDQAITLDSNFTEPVLLLAQLNLGKGNSDTVIASLTDLLRRQPSAVQALPVLASAYSARERFPDALNALNSYIKAVPKDPQGPFRAGLVLRQMNRPEDARKSFQQSLALATNFYAAIEQLVALDVAAKDLPAAQKRAEEAIILLPKQAEPHVLLAGVHVVKQDIPRAEAELKQAIALEPMLRAPYLILSQLYVSSNRQKEALGQCDALLAKNPKDAGALLLKSMIQSESKDYSDAAATLEKLIAANTNSAPALNNLAYLYAERLGQLDKALELSQRSRKLAPNDPAIADTLGWVHFKRGEYAEAARFIQESAAKLPNEPEIQYHLGMTHWMMGQEDAARLAFQSAVKSPREFEGKAESERRLALLRLDGASTDPVAVKALEKILQENPKDVLLLIKMGGVYERSGQSTKAIPVYEDVLKLNPQALSPMIRLAQLLSLQPAQRDRAMQLARKARELAPSDPNATYTLGRVAFQSGDATWAASLLQEATQRIPNDANVLFDFAQAIYAVGRVAEAEQTAQRALQMNPKFDRANAAQWFVQMVALYLRPEGLDTAEPRVNDLLKADPNHVPGLMARSLLLERRKQFKEAAEVCEKALDLYPTFNPARRDLAVLYAERLGQDQKAYDLAAKARQTMPSDAELARVLGKLAFRKGDFRYAIQMLQEVSGKPQMDAESLYCLGLAQVETKQPAQAKPLLERALAADPNSPLAAKARTALATIK